MCSGCDGEAETVKIFLFNEMRLSLLTNRSRMSAGDGEGVSAKTVQLEFETDQ